MTPAAQQVVYGLVVGLPSFLLGYLAYRRSRKVDAISAQSGVATETRAGTAQIIEGLNQLIDQLQDDNRSFREDIKSMTENIRYLTARLDAREVERDQLKRRLNQLNRKYGENGGNSDIRIVDGG
jgi:septal ring factor EnvC (AmiA/AmiB activator)